MNEPKKYVPKSSAKAVSFQSGGSLIKIGFNADMLIEFVKANTNDRGYINLVVAERREPSQHGDTHSVYLDTWKPKEGGQKSARPAASTPPNRYAPPTETDESPF